MIWNVQNRQNNTLAIDEKSWTTGIDPDAGNDWRQKERRAAEDEMVRQCHWLSGHDLEQTPGDSKGQRSLACYSPWGSERVRYDLVTEQQCIEKIDSWLPRTGGDRDNREVAAKDLVFRFGTVKIFWLSLYGSVNIVRKKIFTL